MKRRLISNFFILSILLVGAAGCLKDKGFDNHKYGIKDPNESPVGVGFPEASARVNVYSIEVRNTAQTLTIPLVNLLSDEPAAEDIHVTLQVNPALVDNYNAANNPDLIKLPETAYNIPNLTVLIPKGQRTGTLMLTIPDATVLNPSNRYGIGYTIASVQEAGVIIASNLKDVLFAITIRNAYDGDYEISVNLTGHPSASGQYDEEGTFSTIDATSVDAPLGVAEIFATASRLVISVNADNSLSISSNVAVITADPVKNFYDPASRTFHFDYTWGAGPRHIVGTARRL